MYIVKSLSQIEPLGSKLATTPAEKSAPACMGGEGEKILPYCCLGGGGVELADGGFYLKNLNKQKKYTEKWGNFLRIDGVVWLGDIEKVQPLNRFSAFSTP